MQDILVKRFPGWFVIFLLLHCRLRWFIHIIPTACDALFVKVLEEVSPPHADINAGKIRKSAINEPAGAHVEVSTFFTTQVSAIEPLLINEIVLIDLNTGINNRNNMKAWLQ